MLELLWIVSLIVVVYMIYDIIRSAIVYINRSPETKARDERIAARLAERMPAIILEREKEEIRQHEHEFRLKRARK